MDSAQSKARWGVLYDEGLKLAAAKSKNTKTNIPSEKVAKFIHNVVKKEKAAGLYSRMPAPMLHDFDDETGVCEDCLPRRVRGLTYRCHSCASTGNVVCDHIHSVEEALQDVRTHLPGFIMCAKCYRVMKQTDMESHKAGKKCNHPGLAIKPNCERWARGEACDLSLCRLFTVHICSTPKCSNYYHCGTHCSFAELPAELLEFVYFGVLQ
eukprot:181083_1